MGQGNEEHPAEGNQSADWQSPQESQKQSHQQKDEHQHRHHHSHHHRHRRHISKKEKKKKIIQAVTAILLVIGAVLFVRNSIVIYRQRKEIESRIAARQNETELDLTNIAFQGIVPEGDAALPELKEEVKQGSTTYKRNPNLRTYLFMGIDRKGEFQKEKPGGGGQSDVIILMIQDVTTKEVKLLTIPRDTMTNIKMFDLAGSYVGKAVRQVTLAYAYGDGMEESCRLLSEAVTELLGGVTIDGYMAINIEALPIMNDEVGGVTVTIDDPYLQERNPRLKYGKQVTLLGKDAEDYLRIRNIEEDNTALSRMNRHSVYMNAWMAAAHEAVNKDDTFGARMMDSVQPYMVTDMPKDRYLKLGLDTLMSQSGIANADRYTLPGTPRIGLLHDEYIPDEHAIRNMVLEIYYQPET